MSVRTSIAVEHHAWQLRRKLDLKFTWNRSPGLNCEVFHIWSDFVQPDPETSECHRRVSLLLRTQPSWRCMLRRLLTLQTTRRWPQNAPKLKLASPEDPASDDGQTICVDSVFFFTFLTPRFGRVQFVTNRPSACPCIFSCKSPSSALHVV